MEERDLFREYTKQKPVSAREFHELMKLEKEFPTTRLVLKMEEAIESARDNLGHFFIEGLKEKRPEIFERLSESLKLKDKTRNKVLNEEGNKYVR